MIVRVMIFMIMQPILTHMMVIMIYLFTISKENLDHSFKEVQVHFFFLFITFPWFDKGAVASIVVFFYYICRKKRQI